MPGRADTLKDLCFGDEGEEVMTLRCRQEKDCASRAGSSCIIKLLTCNSDTDGSLDQAPPHTVPMHTPFLPPRAPRYQYHIHSCTCAIDSPYLQAAPGLTTALMLLGC